MIPHRVRVSERATGRLRYLKSRTGLTPNILGRFAFVLSARDMCRLAHGPGDLAGLEFNAPTLFGEHQELYELLLVRYAETASDERDPGLVIASHIETGLHKMGHLRSLEDMAALK
ncbi:MAG: DndE family protein [Gammaproteobacteria bacterium]|nr:DndE family protein [Gammaproteobacteria bacterium]